MDLFSLTEGEIELSQEFPHPELQIDLTLGVEAQY